MKYLSINTETTGLDRENNQIIEFGAIIEDTENPLSFEESEKFHCYVSHKTYLGSAYAINLNQRIFKILKEGTDPNILCVDNLITQFSKFVFNNFRGKVTVAGKNFRDFDYEFIKRLPDWNKYEHTINFHRRYIDPANLYWKPQEDSELPNQNECLRRAGINEVVVHTALGDAWQVIQLIRKYYNIK